MIQGAPLRLRRLSARRLNIKLTRALAVPRIPACYRQRGVPAAGAGGIPGLVEKFVERGVAGDHGGGVHRAVAVCGGAGVVFGAVSVEEGGAVNVVCYRFEV